FVPDGNIHLVSVGSPGLLALGIMNRSAAPDTGSFSAMGTITAHDSSSINAGSSQTSGRVVIRAGSLVMDNARIVVDAGIGKPLSGVDIDLRDSFLASNASGVAVSTGRDFGRGRI